jgi:SHS family lactate transporter-like MFS transporter
MEAVQLFRSLDRNQRNTFLACFLGWALDAFDFFLLTFVIVPMAGDFERSIAELTYAITLTLAMRPLGAFIFGLLGDRFGRRIPIDTSFLFSHGIAHGISPNFTWLLIFRALESAWANGDLARRWQWNPARLQRADCFGILQQVMRLVICLLYWIVFPFFGWRGLFVAGALPAFLVLYIRARVPESPVWLQQQHETRDFWSDLLVVLKRHWVLFVYVILLMTAFNAMSHGTQDMYQTFLGEQRHYGVTQKAATGIIYAVGAICGGTVVGHLSQKWGRRRSIILAAVFGIIFIPLWVFPPGFALLVIGGFAMQFMVQGAWGIVPVHLNELSPGALRGTFPGVAYQLGNLFAANTAVIEARLADHFRDASGHPDYAKALALFTLVIFLVLILLAAIGREERGKEF